MLDSSTYVGGLPIGAIVSGQFAGKAQFLPCDGADYTKAAYPAMADFTGLASFGSNTLQTRTLPASSQWCAVAYGNGMFVAVSKTSGTDAASSPDGITWTSRTIPSGAYNAVAYANGLFVAVGSNLVSTSPDGITWTSRTAGTNQGGCVSYGGGLWVSGGSGITSADANTYATSPDGVTWTSRTLPASASYAVIKWLGDRWAALAYSVSGAATTVMYWSVDAVTWYSVPSPLSSSWYNIESFKGRLFLSASTGSMVSLPEAAYVGASSALSAGWSWLGAPDVSIYLSKVGEWLLKWAGNGLVSASLDGQTWRPLVGLPAMTVQNPHMHIAFGNNALVFLHGGAAQTAAYSLSVDTAKFRLPLVRSFSEVDRPYMKVA